MRTAVTLDPETEHLLRGAVRQRGQSFKEVLNQAVARGLADLRCDADEGSFVPPAFPMGLRTGHDPAHPGALGEAIEVDAFLDLSHRLSERGTSR